MSSDIDITLEWQSPLPVDDLPTVQAYALLQTLGVSKTSILRKLGYDPDEEMAVSQVENAQATANNPVSQQMQPPGQGGIPQAPVPPQPPLQGGNQQTGGALQ